MGACVTGDPIPGSNHVARFCPSSTLDDDGRVTSASFMLRRDESGQPKEEYLSVNWLEEAGGEDRATQMNAVRSLNTLKKKKKDVFSVLNVGAVQELVRIGTEGSRAIPIRHMPEDGPPPDPSHAGIFDTVADEDSIAGLIAEVATDSPCVPAIP